MDLKSKIDSFFGITEKGSSFKTEIRAGIVTFLAMSYILAVNPSMLSDDTGMSFGAALSGTIIASSIACLVMALYAKFPVALAPGMGINAFFTFTIIFTLGYTWEQALAAVFIMSILFISLSVFGLRVKILDAIPLGLRKSITAGIGLFIIFIGLQGADIIVADPATLVTLGDLSSPAVLVALFGIILTLLLFFKKVPGGILIGMCVTAVVGMFAGVIAIPESVVAVPEAPYFLNFWDGLVSVTWDFQYFVVIISLLFVVLFDSAGTILSVGDRAGFVNNNGSLAGGEKALLADSIGTMSGAVVGTSPVTAYIESNVGIELGGRTGFMTLVVAFMFLIALFLEPVFAIFSYTCTISALIIVGCLMASELKSLEWDDFPIVVTSFTTILMMLFSYSITDGIGFGIIMYSLCMIFSGRYKEVNPGIYIMAVVFVIYFLMTANVL